MKNSEIHELTQEELEKQLEDTKKELLNLKIQAKIGQLENSARIRLLRRLIARIITEKKSRLKATT